VPISYEDQVIGIITLESDQFGAFATEHVRFVELLADHAAIGINNAQLFQQVMEGRDRLEAILNSTHDAVIMLDEAGKATLLNPQVSELFGPLANRWLRSVSLLDEPQVLESNVLRFTDLDCGSLAKLISKVREHPDQVVEIHFGFEVADQHRFVEGTASPVFNTAGQVIGRVAVLRDVTRRQEVEQFREDLTSMVIHNLQGPLAALITSLETLWTDGLGKAEMAEELLRIALSSAQKLFSRIDSVLWIRRLEDKKMPINLHTVPLPGVVEMVVDEYRSMAATAGVCLETSFAPDLLPVMIDEEMIGRVFSNLLDNALKYTPGGGRILMQATLAGDGEHPYVQCVVSDTGCGIAPYFQDLIFDKFRRGEATPRGRRKGMGIGLYFCKLAVEGHGGHIWVESDKGRGTRFYFTLPVAIGSL
jgi:signal transduction histidine kinase